MFSWRIFVTSYATQAEITRFCSGLPQPAFVSALPFGRTTFVIAIGFE